MFNTIKTILARIQNVPAPTNAVVESQITNSEYDAMQFNRKKLLQRQKEYLIFKNSTLIPLQEMVDIFDCIGDLPHHYFDHFRTLNDMIDAAYYFFKSELDSLADEKQQNDSLFSCSPYAYIDQVHQRCDRLAENTENIEKQMKKINIQSEIILNEHLFSYLQFTENQKIAFDKILDNISRLVETLRYY